MKLTPAMKIIIAVAAICLAITLITTNNIATVMVLHGLGSTPTAAAPSAGNNNQSVDNSNQGGYVDNSSQQQTVVPETTQPSADANQQANTGNNANTDKKPEAPQSGKMTTEQIVDLYKKGINNVHTNAKTAVRVKDGAINYNKIVEAGALSSAASSLMGMFMVPDEASIEVKNEEWDKANVPPKSCNLTAAGVKSATCEEKGGKYIVTIVAKDATNPKAGGDGIGSLIDVIEESQITGSISSVPGLSLNNISIAYENVTVVATIDKATGNIENIKINAPCVLQLSAKLLVASIDNAKVGIQVISEFAMTY